MLNTADKRYIDSAIIKSHKRFQKDTERYIGALMEKRSEEFQTLRELVEVRPTREEVGEMIQEEVRPIRQDIAIFKEEMILSRVAA